MPSDQVETLAKKRVRDRRAQAAHRQRSIARVKHLELEAETWAKTLQTLQEGHASEVRRLQAVNEALRRENTALRTRQATAIGLLHNLGTETNAPLIVDAPPHPGRPSLPDPFAGTLTNDHDDVWRERPLHTEYDENVELLMPYILFPAVIRPLDDIPSGADLLFGSTDNPLANAIHVALVCSRYGTMTSSERLAFGWLAYILTKWQTEPTRERFSRLPDFLRPTRLQTTCAHSPFIDLIPWPRMRDNIIAADLQGTETIRVLRALAPALAHPWSSETPLLELDPQNRGHMVVKQTFLDMITRLDSWTYSATFTEQFPHLARAYIES